MSIADDFFDSKTVTFDLPPDDCPPKERPSHSVRYLTADCPFCSAPIHYDTTATQVSCEYCGCKSYAPTPVEPKAQDSSAPAESIDPQSNIRPSAMTDMITKGKILLSQREKNSWEKDTELMVRRLTENIDPKLSGEHILVTTPRKFSDRSSDIQNRYFKAYAQDLTPLYTISGNWTGPNPCLGIKDEDGNGIAQVSSEVSQMHILFAKIEDKNDYSHTLYIHDEKVGSLHTSIDSDGTVHFLQYTGFSKTKIKRGKITLFRKRTPVAAIETDYIGDFRQYYIHIAEKKDRTLLLLLSLCMEIARRNSKPTEPKTFSIFDTF